MIPVMQRRTELGIGDCLHACLASILECSIDDIPDLSSNCASLLHQIENENAFLASRGLKAIRCHMTGGYESGDVLFCFDGYAIAHGVSPRGKTQHAVVVRSNDGMIEIAHDPHPDGSGIKGEFTGIEWLVPVQ